MERYIGIDVHAASCTIAVISEAGKKLKDFPVETNGQALVEAIRMIPGHKHLVFEEGLQSAWLYETLGRHVDETVVAGVTESRGQKDDRRDAYGLAEKLRRGTLEKRIFKAPRQFRVLRELSRIHVTAAHDLVRVQARIKSLYRSRGIGVPGGSVYSECHRESWCCKTAERDDEENEFRSRSARAATRAAQGTHGGLKTSTRGRLGNAEADARIEESGANGEVRLAILPYGSPYKRVFYVR